MKKDRQQFYKSSNDVPEDPNRYVITRADLEGQECEIYDRLFPELEDPSPDQLRMLATFAYIAVEFKKAAENKKLATYLRRCMVYARNRLGLWKPEPVDPMELLLDCEDDWPGVLLYLDRDWEILEQ
jgi:hypothetical protein